MSSNHNSRPRTAQVLVDGDQSYLSRRRETLQELWALESNHLIFLILKRRKKERKERKGGEEGRGEEGRGWRESGKKYLFYRTLLFLSINKPSPPNSKFVR